MSAISKRDLLDEVLVLIRQAGAYRLAPGMLFLIGGSDVEVFASRWDELSRHVASAKLAIIRDEFSNRFPSLTIETGWFTFGIADPLVDRYMQFLKPREPADITNLVMAMLDTLFPARGWLRKRRPEGLASLGTRITGTLTTYCQSIEAKFAPYAESFGVSAR